MRLALVLLARTATEHNQIAKAVAASSSTL